MTGTTGVPPVDTLGLLKPGQRPVTQETPWRSQGLCAARNTAGCAATHCPLRRAPPQSPRPATRRATLSRRGRHSLQQPVGLSRRDRRTRSACAPCSMRTLARDQRASVRRRRLSSHILSFQPFQDGAVQQKREKTYMRNSLVVRPEPPIAVRNDQSAENIACSEKR